MRRRTSPPSTRWPILAPSRKTQRNSTNDKRAALTDCRAAVNASATSIGAFADLAGGRAAWRAGGQLLCWAPSLAGRESDHPVAPMLQRKDLLCSNPFVKPSQARDRVAVTVAIIAGSWRNALGAAAKGCREQKKRSGTEGICPKSCARSKIFSVRGTLAHPPLQLQEGFFFFQIPHPLVLPVLGCLAHHPAHHPPPRTHVRTSPPPCPPSTSS